MIEEHMKILQDGCKDVKDTKKQQKIWLSQVWQTGINLGKARSVYMAKIESLRSSVQI